ncbi:MAG TPA: hypothetical protein VF017_11600 [Thermoanaerobaculia bacterium]|nr:hypothetical protein [Thermoanaerobaculia bacterium]
MDPGWIKVLLLCRLVAYMAVIYLLFGLVVEWRSRKPDSKLRSFARLLASPLTRPVARLMPEGTLYPRLLRVTTLITIGLWLALTVASELALASARS